MQSTKGENERSERGDIPKCKRHGIVCRENCCCIDAELFFRGAVLWWLRVGLVRVPCVVEVFAVRGADCFVELVIKLLYSAHCWLRAHFWQPNVGRQYIKRPHTRPEALHFLFVHGHGYTREPNDTLGKRLLQFECTEFCGIPTKLTYDRNVAISSMRLGL